MLHYTRLHILASSYLLHGIRLRIPFCIIFQTFYMELISGEFPGHYRKGIPLHYMIVLAHLELWHGARSCIKIRVMEWRDIMYKDISILWEHNSFTYHFNIMDTIILFFLHYPCHYSVFLEEIGLCCYIAPILSHLLAIL